MGIVVGVVGVYEECKGQRSSKEQWLYQGTFVVTKNRLAQQWTHCGSSTPPSPAPLIVSREEQQYYTCFSAGLKQ